jgi:hypothetical protein
LGDALGVWYRDAKRTGGKTTIKNSVFRLRFSPHLTFCIYSLDEKHK